MNNTNITWQILNATQFYIPILSPIFYSIEYSVLILSLFSNTIFGWVLWKTSCLHQNLRVLFLSLVFTTYGYFLARSYLVIDGIFFHVYLMEHTNELIQHFIFFFQILFASAYTFDLIGIMIERVISTKFSKNYEKMKKPVYAVFLVPWIVNVISSALLGPLLIPINMSLPMIIFTFALILCCLVTWMCLFILYKINTSYYQKAFTLTLSHKYQVAENIRAVRMTFIYILLTTITNASASVLLFLQGFYLVPNLITQVSYYMLTEHIRDLIIAVYILVFPITLIYTHRNLRKKFQEKFLRRCYSVTEKYQQKNVLGQKLIMDAHGQDYFEGLENQWNNIFTLKEKIGDTKRKHKWGMVKNRINPEVFVINSLKK